MHTMERFLRTEEDTLQLRLIAALGAAAALYLHQSELSLAWILGGSLGYLLYVNYSLLLKYYLLRRFPSLYLAYGMIVVDTLALSGILFVINGVNSAFMMLFPVFILYYSIHLGYMGSFVAATVAALGVAAYAFTAGAEAAPLRIWVPFMGMFYLVATIGGYMGHRGLKHEVEKEALQDLVNVEGEWRRRRQALGSSPGRELATVLFTDIVASTEQAMALGDRRWRELLDNHHAAVRQELARFGGYEVKTLGDGFLATFERPAQAIHCACAIVDSVRELGIETRAGLHTGEFEVMESDLGGIAVHIAARVLSVARPSEVLVSSTVKDLVTGSDIRFEDRGIFTLKGLPEEWRLFAVQREESAAHE